METYPQIYSLLNLWLAFQKSSCGRHSHTSVASYEYDLEKNLIELRDELRNEIYRPGGYTNFFVHEPKKRKISAAPFRDRVLHHALMNIIGPSLERCPCTPRGCVMTVEGQHPARRHRPHADESSGQWPSQKKTSEVLKTSEVSCAGSQ